MKHRKPTQLQRHPDSHPTVALAAADRRLVSFWRKLPLIKRLALLAVLPAAVTSLVLVVLLTRLHLNELNRTTANDAELLATQVATLLFVPLRDYDRVTLNRIAASVQGGKITAIQVASADGEIVARLDGEAQGGRTPRLKIRRAVSDPNNPQATVGSVALEVSLEDISRVEREHFVTALIAVLASLAAASLMAWWAARRVGSPVVTLAHAIERLGHGSFDVLVPVTDEAEIGALQRGFNTAATTLLNARHTMELSIDEAIQALVRKNKALEAANRGKTRFLASASHDLRQPLYALTLLCDGLKASETNPSRQERLQMMSHCASSLDRLLQELLELTRMDSGVVKPTLQSFPLQGLFDDVDGNFRVVAQSHGLTFRVRATPFWVYSDRNMLIRIVNNLVSNALRYTSQGGVLVGARRVGRHVSIEVWDTGAGISEEHLEHVFEEFYRITDGSVRARSADSEPGLGLGLATVQRLVRLLEGEVTVKSRPGRGSVFKVTVAGWLRGERAQPRLRSRLQGVRVLLVDDDLAVLKAVRLILETWGCAVRTANDGQHLVMALGDWPSPDLVISAQQFRDGSSGHAVFSWLDEHGRSQGSHGNPATPGSRKTPAFARLLVTGSGETHGPAEGVQPGLHCISKPISPEQLRLAVFAALDAHPADGAL